MNIIEAIKSGKPFKRKSGDIYAESCEFLRFKVEEILADDWEIQEKTIQITESQFDEAFDRCKIRDNWWKEFKKELGF